MRFPKNREFLEFCWKLVGPNSLSDKESGPREKLSFLSRKTLTFLKIWNLAKKNRLTISGELFEVIFKLDLVWFCHNNIVIWNYNPNVIIQYRRYSIQWDYSMILIWSLLHHLRLPLNVINHFIIGPIKSVWNHTSFFSKLHYWIGMFFSHFSLISTRNIDRTKA